VKHPTGRSVDRGDIPIGMAGTFDVENYGDLLFPLLARAALAERDLRIRVVPFSVNSRSQPSWPFEVHATSVLPDVITDLAAMLIGGGQIVRFDSVYPVAAPSDANLHVGYWLMPALLAVMAGKPLIWNAVGVWTGSPPAGPHYDDILCRVLTASHLVGVRDLASHEQLTSRAATAPVQFIPDTAFLLARCWPLRRESADYTEWRRMLALDRPYVVIQANHAIGAYGASLKMILRTLGNVAAVVLPVCWCHGDRAQGFPLDSPDTAVGLSASWPSPQLISEIIGRAEAVVASSLHACITGLSYGVPVVRAPTGPVPHDRKYEVLRGFAGLADITDPDSISRVLRRGHGPDPLVEDYAQRLERYWDQVADIVLMAARQQVSAFSVHETGHELRI
jgi:lipopolysaccharide transport system ATP-binding protein